MKQPEYTEGAEALKNFERFATAILQAPVQKKKKQTKKSASQEKPQKSDKDYKGTCVSPPAPVGA